MSFFYEVSRATQSAYSALNALNAFDFNADPRTSYNTGVLNNAHRELVNTAIPSANQALYSAPRERVHQNKAWQVSNAVQYLTDATWDLTSYSKHGGQDMPNPSGAKWQIERGIDLLRQAEDRWNTRGPSTWNPGRPPAPWFPPYHRGPGPIIPVIRGRRGPSVYVPAPGRGPGGPNRPPSGWHPGSGRPAPPRW